MKIISWNINAINQKKRIKEIFNILDQNRADLIALQEVSVPFINDFQNYFTNKNYNFKDFSFIEKRYCNIVASKYSFEVLSTEWIIKPPFPNLLSRILLNTDNGELDFFNIHIPNGSNHGMKKIDSIEALLEELKKESVIPRIVVGDFNEPYRETLEGEIETWAFQKRKNTLTKDEKTRWHNVVTTLFNTKESNVIDAYRDKHGYLKQISSVSIKNRKNPIRYDHCFVSIGLCVKCCDYDLSVIANNISDHALLVIEIQYQFRPP